MVTGSCSAWRTATGGAPLLGVGLFLTFVSDLQMEAEATLSKSKDDNKLGVAAEKLGVRAAM